MILIFIVIIITLCAATRLPTCYNLHHASRDGNGSPCVDPSDRILEWLHQIESMSRMIYFVKKQRVLLPIGTCMHHHHHILFMDKCIYQLIFITYSPQHHVGSVLFSSSLDLVIMKEWEKEGGLENVVGSLLGNLLFTSQCYTHDVCSSARIYILPSKIVYMTWSIIRNTCMLCFFFFYILLKLLCP